MKRLLLSVCILLSVNELYAYNISCVGDSLTYGWGGFGTNYTYELKKQLGVDVTMLGIGGQTSSQIAVRMGIYPTSVTISNNTIPTAGSSCLLYFNPSFLPAGAINNIFVWGSVAGVYGHLTFTTDGTNSFFMPLSNATPVTVSGSTNWVSDVSKSLGDINVIWAGRNDIGSPEVVKSNITAIAAIAGTNTLYLSVLPWVGEANGTYAWKCRTNINGWLSITFSNRYVDVLSVLQANASTNDQDIIDVENDITPTSLRYDAGHLNGAGYTLVGQAVAEKIREVFPPKLQIAVLGNTFKLTTDKIYSGYRLLKSNDLINWDATETNTFDQIIDANTNYMFFRLNFLQN